LPQGTSPDGLALSGIAIDLDFSELDDVGQNATTPDIAPEQNSGAMGGDLPSEEEPPPLAAIEDETILPLGESDDDFAVMTEAEAEAELAVETELEVEPELEVETEVEAVLEGEEAELEEIDLAGSEEPEVELAGEAANPEEDDEEILELEPLEEEDDLAAELAALEALLDAELEEPSPEQTFALNVADDEAAKAALPGDDDFFDLAAEILDEGAMQATEGLANIGEIDRFRFDSVFAEFKKGVDAQIDHEDSEAHYDLGIAYKEMGLMDDAIEEFKKSMRSLKRLADSLILIGICYAEKGAFADAEAVFSTAIARPEVQEADKIGTQYELGLVYEIWGRPTDALRTFEAVAASDASFRNVGEKIEALRLLVAAGAGKAVGDTPGSVSPGKDRISFV
jgi:tetratricopeptide (TPR) repeat protein